MRIGFIGLGGMGRPMAMHLLRAGHELVIWSRRVASSEALMAPGAERITLAEGPQQLAADCQLVCTNVTGNADVSGLAERMLGSFRRDSIHLDFSTIAPSLSRQLAGRYAARQLHFVDAPVSGGTRGAQEATLIIMWGGAATLAPRIEPILRLLGKTVVHVGDSGAGQLAKTCNQWLMVAAIQACAEAAHLANAAGVDFAKVRQALLGGSAASRVLEIFGDKMQRQDFSPGVAARLHHKDFGILLDEVSRSKVAAPVASSVMQQLNALMAAGWGTDDSSRLLSVLQRQQA